MGVELTLSFDSFVDKTKLKMDFFEEINLKNKEKQTGCNNSLLLLLAGKAVLITIITPNVGNISFSFLKNFLKINKKINLFNYC